MISARPPAIRAESLTKDFPSLRRGGGRRALDAVTFAVPAGAVCGLVGANGSGKSTTLKILAGLVRPDAGRAEVCGRRVDEAVRRGQVGFLPDPPAAPDHARADAWLEHVGRLSGLAPAGARAEARAALAATGLDPRATAGLGCILRQLARAGQTVLFTSHLLEQVEDVCDRIILLDEGAVRFDGSASTVAAKGGLRRLYLELAPA